MRDSLSAILWQYLLSFDNYIEVIWYCIPVSFALGIGFQREFIHIWASKVGKAQVAERTQKVRSDSLESWGDEQEDRNDDGISYACDCSGGMKDAWNLGSMLHVTIMWVHDAHDLRFCGSELKMIKSWYVVRTSMGTERTGRHLDKSLEISLIHSTYHEQTVQCTDCKSVQLDKKSIHVYCLERCTFDQHSCQQKERKYFTA
jgi:hypothetical protein